MNIGRSKPNYLQSHYYHVRHSLPRLSMKSSYKEWLFAQQVTQLIVQANINLAGFKQFEQTVIIEYLKDNSKIIIWLYNYLTC